MRIAAWLYIIFGGLVFLMGLASVGSDIQIIVALCGAAMHGIGLVLLAVLKVGKSLATATARSAAI